SPSFVSALTESNSASVHTVGCLLSSLALGAFAHAVLAYPSGRLESRLSRGVVVAAYLDVTIGQLLAALFENHLGPDGVRVPRNVLLVSHNPDLATAFQALEQALGSVLALT